MFQAEQFPVKHPLAPEYVTGFAESCASFTFSRSSGVFTMYFAIKVGARDLPLLQDLRAFFGGAGQVYPVNSASKLSEGKPVAAYYRVTRASELRLVVAHFDRYKLRGAKALQYDVWRVMVDLKQHFRKPDLTALAELATRLSSLKKGASPS